MDEADYEAEITELRRLLREQGAELHDTQRLLGVCKSRMGEISAQSKRIMDLLTAGDTVTARGRVETIMVMAESQIRLPPDREDDAG